MLFIRSLTAFSLLAIIQAAPFPKPKNVFHYDVINVDGSDLKPTESVVQLNKRAYVTETIGYTTTSTQVVPGKKRTVWVTADDDEPETTTSTTPAPEPTLDSSENKQVEPASEDFTVIDGVTYRVIVGVSTIKQARTYTYESTWTSTINGIVETGVDTVVTSTVEGSSTATPAAQTTTPIEETALSDATSTVETSTVETSTEETPSSTQTTSLAPETSSVETTSSAEPSLDGVHKEASASSSSSSTPTTVTSPSSTSTSPNTTSVTPSSVITAAPVESTASESGTPYSTSVGEDGYCEVYYDDGDDYYYVSGSDAVSAYSTTTITNIVYETVSLNQFPRSMIQSSLKSTHSNDVMTFSFALQEILCF